MNRTDEPRRPAMADRRPPLCLDPYGMCGRHPGRVERVGRMSGRGSPALVGVLHMPSPPGRGEEAGRMEGRTSGKSERKRSGRREENEEDGKKQQAAGRKRDAAG